MSDRWTCAFVVLAVAIVGAEVAGLAAGAEGGAQSEIYDPDRLNALPPRTAFDQVRVRGVFSVHTDTDGPYLYQDMQNYGARKNRSQMVAVVRSLRFWSYAERYEAALVVMTGKYRKSGCREPDVICPHMKNELDPASVEIIGYPDKAIAEKLDPDGQVRLREVGASDSEWGAVVAIAQRLVRAIQGRDMKTLRALFDPHDPEWEEALDNSLAPDGEIYWRLFDPESAFVGEGNRQPAFRVFAGRDEESEEKRTLRICFDRGKRRPMAWPDTEFDLSSHNVGDPYACLRAVRTKFGWGLEP